MVNLFQYLIDYLKHAPAIIQLSWLMSAGFFTAIVILIAYLKYLRAALRVNARIKATYQKKYESDLIEYLYSGNDEEISVQQQQIINYFKKCAANELKRKIIISTLLKLRNEISGEIAEAIQKLYYQTGFINQAASKLKHKKWDVVATTIKELAQFGIKEVHDDVIKLIDHPKKEVRKEIQMYLVKLFGFEGLEFLDVIKNQLSEWDQIQLLEILQNTENQKLPDISDWLKSSNDSVISFAIKLAKIYSQFEAKDEITELFNHPNKEIRIEAIGVISHLGISEAIGLLKNDLGERSLEEQIIFFKMAEKMFTREDIPFIQEYVNHENFDIRVSAQKIITLVGSDDSDTIKIDDNKNDNSKKDNLIKAS